MDADQADPGAGIAFRTAEHGWTEVRLELGGERVGGLFVVPRTIRIGEAHVQVDGIAGVETEERHRGRGYGRRVIEATLRRMREGDAALSLLWGIPDYYEQFGYATAGPEYSLTLPVEGGRPAAHPAGWGVRPFAAADLPAVRRIHERGTAGTVGAQVRATVPAEPVGPESPAWSTLLERADRGLCRVVVGPSGAVAGYAWAAEGFWWTEYRPRLRPGSLLLAEALAEGPIAADGLLSGCLSWAAERGREHVEIAAAPEGPLAAAAMLRGATFGVHYSPSGAFMARCLDARRLLDQLLPELTRRLERSGFRHDGTLRIETDEGAVSLRVERGALALGGEQTTERSPSVRMPQQALARLALGAFPPAELLARLPEPPPDEWAELLTTLFPARHQHALPADSF